MPERIFRARPLPIRDPMDLLSSPLLSPLSPDSHPTGAHAPQRVSFRTHTVRGGGGVALRVQDVGDPEGPPLLFIHGFSQCHRAWRRQLHSALGLGFRLVAVDLRGHGDSDKPLGAYAESQLWADDIQAVIRGLGLVRPLLVAWSYGGMVVCDYLRHHGEGELAGVNFVSALVKCGSPEAFGMLAPQMLSLIPGLFTPEEAGSHAALEAFVSLLHHAEVDEETRALVLAYTEGVPTHVREALVARTVDNDDVLARLTVPVLVSHGVEDRVVLPVSGRHIASLVPGVQVSFYGGTGHSPFWEEASRFNRELVAFAARCW